MFDILAAAFQFLGLVGLGVTLVLVWRQGREMGQQTAALAESLAITGATTLDDAFRSVSAVFIEHPQIRALFYPDEGAGPDLNDPTCRLRANAVAEMLCDIFDGWFRLRPDSATWARAGSWYDAFMNDTLRDSVFLRSYLLSRARWYHDDLVALAASHQDVA